MRRLTFWIVGAGVGHSLQKQNKVNDIKKRENPPLIDLNLGTNCVSHIPTVRRGVHVLGSGLQPELGVPPAWPCLSRPRSGHLLTRTCWCFLVRHISLQSKVARFIHTHTLLCTFSRWKMVQTCSTCVFQYNRCLVRLAAGGSYMSVHPDFCRLVYQQFIFN